MSIDRLVVVSLLIALLTACGSKTKEELLAEGVKQLQTNPNGAIVLLKNALEKDQNYIEARYQLATAYEKSGKLEQAEKEFQKVLRQDPSRTDISLRLAEIYADTNRPDLAITETDKYLASHAGDAGALETKGRALAMKGNFDESERLLKESISADDSRTDARLILATVHVNQGREGDARKLIEDIIQRDGKNTKAYYLLAGLEGRRGDRAKVIETYKTITEIDSSDVVAPFRMGILQLNDKEMEASEKIADGLQQNFPKRPEGYLLKGLVQYRKKDFSQAIVSLQNSLKFHSGMLAYYYLGLSHYSRGEYETGISQMRKILDQNPDMSRARLMTAIMLLKLKRIDDAMDEARKVIAKDEANALAHNLLGSALLEKGQVDEGMKELEKATKLDPKLVDAHLKKGVVKLAKGKTGEGEAELEEAVRVGPEILKTRFLLASYYLNKQKHAAALRVLREGLAGTANDASLYNAMAAPLFAQKNNAEALKSLQKAKRLNPALPSPYFNLASYYSSTSDYDRALTELRNLLAQDPKNVAALIGTAEMFEAKGDASQALTQYRKATETGNPASFLVLARFHLKQKDGAAALRVLDEAIKKDPKNLAAVEMKGMVHLEEKRFKEAVTSFEQLAAADAPKGLPLLVSAYVGAGDGRKAEEAARKIIQKNPRSAYGYSVLAGVFENRKDLSRAADALKEGLKVEPKSVPVQMILGRVFAKKREFSEALKVYGKVRQENPKYTPVLFEEAIVHELKGDRKEAVKKYRAVLAVDAKHVLALNNLASLYAEDPGTRKEALEMANRALKLQPESGAIIDTYGYTLLKSGKTVDALKMLEKASSKLPRNPTVLYHLALAQKSAGDAAKAKQNVKRALELGEFPEAAAARQLMGTL